jgi:hypothetical protein
MFKELLKVDLTACSGHRDPESFTNDGQDLLRGFVAESGVEPELTEGRAFDRNMYVVGFVQVVYQLPKRGVVANERFRPVIFIEVAGYALSDIGGIIFMQNEFFVWSYQEGMMGVHDLYEPGLDNDLGILSVGPHIEGSTQGRYRYFTGMNAERPILVRGYAEEGLSPQLDGSPGGILEFLGVRYCGIPIKDNNRSVRQCIRHSAGWGS